MKHQISKIKNQIAGFTLIEMLVVIAVIGVLAVAIFVAISPAEQMAKARDGGRVSTGKEIVDACERYFVGQDACPSAIEGAAATTLEGSGELKDKDYSDFTLSCSAGDCTVSFTAESKAYTSRCGGATCTVPTSFE